MKKKLSIISTLLLLMFITTFAEKNMEGKVENPKYIFYFIGDGMGASQRQVAEYFAQHIYNQNDYKLQMNRLPVSGINTTFSTSSLVTDSAAAGTALATGHKTYKGGISCSEDGTSFKTLVEAAEEKGMETGLISTTRLTHATPAVFASHNADRDNENEIAADFIDNMKQFGNGIDYFAGGGYRHFIGKEYAKANKLKSKRKDDRDLLQEFKDSGYDTFITEKNSKAFMDYTPKKGSQVFAAFTYSHFPYEIDRVNSMTDNSVIEYDQKNNFNSKKTEVKKEKKYLPSLAELTKKGIEVLSDNEKGFFMMVEGGRIDHAAHGNDALTMIKDILALDDAIAEAYEFYLKHPKETLIVVTADHETGGIGLGFGENYYLKMDKLEKQIVSISDTLPKIYNGNRAAYYKYLEENLGLSDFTKEEKSRIESAMDKKDDKDKTNDKISKYNDLLATTIAHIMSERANVGWTTYAHTGSPVILSAVGSQAEKFNGFKDNTEVAKTLAEVVGLDL